MSYGIDISNNNDPAAVDWDGVSFCFIKVSESTNFRDKLYPQYRAECQTRGIPWGPYHFAHPDVNSPAAEASFFLSTFFHSPADQPPLPPALDIETRTGYNPLLIMGPNNLARWIDSWCEIVQHTLGCPPPFFYTFKSYASQLLPRIGAWPLWLATAAGQPSMKQFAGHDIAIEQYGAIDHLDRNESYLPLIPSQPGDDDMAAHLVLLDDGKVVAFPSNGDRPWWIPNSQVLAIGQVLGFFGPSPTTPSSASESDAIRQALDTAGSGGTAPTHFKGIVDIVAAP